jgi:hypothetical protein
MQRRCQRREHHGAEFGSAQGQVSLMSSNPGQGSPYGRSLTRAGRAEDEVAGLVAWRYLGWRANTRTGKG